MELLQLYNAISNLSVEQLSSQNFTLNVVSESDPEGEFLSFRWAGVQSVKPGELVILLNPIMGDLHNMTFGDFLMIVENSVKDFPMSNVIFKDVASREFSVVDFFIHEEDGVLDKGHAAIRVAKRSVVLHEYVLEETVLSVRKYFVALPKGSSESDIREAAFSFGQYTVASEHVEEFEIKDLGLREEPLDL